MFDIAFSELVVIGLIALVVLGPKRLPELARAAGRWTARLRRFVEDVKRDVSLEMHKDELAELRQVKDQLTETKQLFETSASGTLAALGEIRPPEPTPDYQVKALPQPEPAPAPKKKRNTTARPKTKKTATRHVRTKRQSKS